jgi:secretion/DNA translocation related TadE-like protein
VIDRACGASARGIADPPRQRGARSRGGSALRAERGSASVLVALWSLVLTMLAAGAIVLSSALAARAAVSAAADLAALAGASAALTDPGQACKRASAIARENNANLVECRLRGTEVWVVARAPAPPSVQWLLPGRGASLSARAHAELAATDA